MRKAPRLLVALLAAFVFSYSAFAQSTINGRVTSSNAGEPVSGVSVTVKNNRSVGTLTDSSGRFQLRVPSLPVILVLSSVGYETQELTVTSTSPVLVSFMPSDLIGQAVVVSASRVPQRILEAPVTIERVSAATIRTAPVQNYYDILSKLKGVDVVYSSMTFNTPTTRGFSGSGNLRFNQLVDGIDNQAPGLNFAVGSVIGLTELDVESMELLPGATSALYGPGGMNGTLLITSKNPFKYTGLSLQSKVGFLHFGDIGRSRSPYFNGSLRWAQKVSERFAYKLTGEIITAKDWLGRDYRNYKRLGTNGVIADGDRATDPNYDGVNVYGDETSVNLKTLLSGFAQQIPFLAGYISTLPSVINVSRTGYTENEVADPTTKNIKLSGSVNYKLGKNVEAILEGFWGTGNTVYTGSDRYSLKDLKVGQYKLELAAKNWFLRGYTTQENAGESHNLTVTTRLFNEAWKPTVTRDAAGNPTPKASDWLVQYGFAYLNAKQAGHSDLEAHNMARAVADQGRPVAGTPEFKRIFDSVRKVPIPNGGLFLDRSDLWMAEGQYNFSNIKWAEILVGGNWKQYVLNSEGTLFADTKGQPIKINEFGSYIQIGRELIKDRLKLTASGRYDKNENFKGRFTPRFTAVIKTAQDHNIRLSYQTAYRFPSTQQQWIDLQVGAGRLIGANRILWEKYNLINNPGKDPITGETVIYKEVKPESVTAFEGGYKALIKKRLLLDVYGYYGSYQDFISRRDVAQNNNGTITGISVVINAPGKVHIYGWGGGVEYLLPNNFVVSGSLTSDRIDNVASGFHASFSTPLLRSIASLSNSGFGPGKKFGANVSWRWQDGFFYESDFVQGDLPAYHTVDAAVSYKLTNIKSLLKLGATNLLNQYYRTGLGNPSIGGLYYVSFAYNVL